MAMSSASAVTTAKISATRSQRRVDVAHAQSDHQRVAGMPAGAATSAIAAQSVEIAGDRRGAGRHLGQLLHRGRRQRGPFTTRAEHSGFRHRSVDDDTRRPSRSAGRARRGTPAPARAWGSGGRCSRHGGGWRRRRGSPIHHRRRGGRSAAAGRRAHRPDTGRARTRCPPRCRRRPPPAAPPARRAIERCSDQAARAQV